MKKIFEIRSLDEEPYRDVDVIARSGWELKIHFTCAGKLLSYFNGPFCGALNVILSLEPTGPL